MRALRSGIWFQLGLATFVASVQLFAGAPAQAATTVRIAILSDAEWKLEPIDTIVRGELQALLEGEFDVQFPDSAQVHAGGSTERAGELLSELLARDDIDIVVALGPRATHAIGEFDDLPKPTFGTLVLDHELQQFPQTAEGTSGKRNLAYLAQTSSIGEVLTEFNALTPLHRVAFLIEPSYIAGADEVGDIASQLSDESGVEIVAVAAERPYAANVGAIPGDIDGVIVGPLLEETEADVRALAAALQARKLPSFAVASSREVELGLLASLSPSKDFTRLGRKLAFQIQDVLLGTRPQDLPVAREWLRELTINLDTARALDIPVTYDMLGNARLVGSGESGHGRALSLEQAVNESLRENLDLKSQERVVAAGREDVFLALSALLPQASLSASWSRIDDERTAPGVPEVKTKAGLSAQQILFDQARAANIFIAESGVDALEQAREQVRQDVIQASARAFIEVLRAEATFEVQRSNLEVTSRNLEYAQTRNELGAADAGEVLRWESEEANAARGVVDARAAVQNQSIVLNRILNRPLDEEFVATALVLEDLTYTFADPRVAQFFEAPFRFRNVQRFLVRRALKHAPELAVLDAQIESQERLITSRKFAFAAPTLAAQAQVDEVIDEDGQGRNPRGVRDTSWSVGIEASLPLSTGGGRIFELRQAREDLSRLRIDRRAEVLAVEERVRTSSNDAAASFIAIELTATSAAAAKRNLELVTDSYARGALSVINLVDAQDNAFAAQQQASTAVYDHLIDLFELQRSMGNFEFFQSKTERESALRRLDDFLQSAPHPSAETETQ